MTKTLFFALLAMLMTGTLQAGGAGDEFAQMECSGGCPFANSCSPSGPQGRLVLTENRHSRCRLAGGAFRFCDSCCSPPPADYCQREAMRLFHSVEEQYPNNNPFFNDFIDGVLTGAGGIR